MMELSRFNLLLLFIPFEYINSCILFLLYIDAACSLFSLEIFIFAFCSFPKQLNATNLLPDGERGENKCPSSDDDDKIPLLVFHFTSAPRMEGKPPASPTGSLVKKKPRTYGKLQEETKQLIEQKKAEDKSF